MQPLSQTDMMEATRLTREGRLEEAMALLQGARRTQTRPAQDQAPERPAKTFGRRAQPLIDMLPPSASGGAWSPPPMGGTSAAGGSGTPTPPGTPRMARGLLERMGELGASYGAGAGPTGGLSGKLGAALGTGNGLGEGLGEMLQGKLGSLGGAFGTPAQRAPATLPEGARFEERIYTDQAGTRPYKLYVPSTYGGQALPLVVMLHGCTQSPDDFAAGTRMNELAEELGFLVAYPGQTPAANMQKCWNWFNAADQQRDRGEPSLIAGITRSLMQDLLVDPGQVYIAGLSAGGAAAAIMGVSYPDLYAAVGVHSGLACGSAQDMVSAFSAMKQGGGGRLRASSGRPVPTIVFHGDRDATVHSVNGEEVATQALAGQVHRTEVDQGTSGGGMPFTRTIHRDDRGRAMLEQWVLHGAGHAWSGGSAAGSYTDPAGPDASREMMRFFLQQSLPAKSPD